MNGTSFRYKVKNNGKTENIKMIRRALRRIMTKGLYGSMRKLRAEWKIYTAHRKGLFFARRFRKERDLKLHLGCGKVIKKDFINIDLSDEADLTLDLRENFPFAENSCSMIYSEHFLEHLSYPDEVTFFLKECYRVLKKGGIFSVGVPGTEWPIRAYIDPRYANYFQYAKKEWHPEWCTTKMEHINHHFRQKEEHKFAYDFETLKHILEIAHFVNIQQRDFNFELDSKKRELNTLYANAVKL